MSMFGFEAMFAPKSIALVGGSPRQGSVGAAVLTNLIRAGFAGPIAVVNPKHGAIGGKATVRTLADVKPSPDLVIITTPPRYVMAILKDAVKVGARAALLLSSDLGRGRSSVAEEAKAFAHKTGLRLVGPDCLGVMAPHINLNASFAARSAPKGDLAFISQSGAIAASMLDWAERKHVGFSGLVSIGEQIDADFADFLDYFAQDRRTRTILMYVESIKDARKFMSAARAAARAKPVVVVKSGRHGQRQAAARSHTGALAAEDAVFDAAFRRAGLLRVLDLGELFTAAETLGRIGQFSGDRVAVLTNGSGLGVLAVDKLIDLGGRLAELSKDTHDALNAVLPPAWSKTNPVDILDDADPERYAKAMQALMDDKGNDLVFVINCPTALVSSKQTAQAVADVTIADRKKRLRAKPVFAVWLGDVEASNAIFREARMPSFFSEDRAVEGLMHVISYKRAQNQLTEMPPGLPEGFSPDRDRARAVIADALKRREDGKRFWLHPLDVQAILEAYQIPVVPLRHAKTPAEAEQAARALLENNKNGIAIKILSPDIIHKSDIGGVRLGLMTPHAVREAAAAMLKTIAISHPQARIEGVALQPMVVRERAVELIAGIADDKTFGPVVLFGRGGTAVEVIRDKALALPPLDLNMARDTISRTRVSGLLRGYRDVPPSDMAAIELILVKLAQLAADLPDVREVDLNPLLANYQGVIALDSRISVEAEKTLKGTQFANPRFAIRPYPAEWEKDFTLKDGSKVLVRPVRPEDEAIYVEFFKHTTPEDMRMRFFAPIKELDHAAIARLVQIDYSRSMAFCAINPATGELLGAARLHADALHKEAEYGIMVRSQMKRTGLGSVLMRRLIDYGRADGLEAIVGQVLRENAPMIGLCTHLGFTTSMDPDDRDIVRVTYDLTAPR